MAEGSNGRRRFSDKWGKHELDVLAVLSSAFPQWLTSRQIAQRVKRMPIRTESSPIKQRRPPSPSNSSVTAPSSPPWASPSNQGSRNIPPSQKGRISLPTVCSLAMSRACVCCSATRICRFLPLRITLRAPCRFPRLLRTNPSTLPVPRRACRRRRFQDLAWIPSRRVLARNPFPTSWSKCRSATFRRHCGC